MVEVLLTVGLVFGVTFGVPDMVAVAELVAGAKVGLGMTVTTGAGVVIVWVVGNLPRSQSR